MYLAPLTYDYFFKKVFNNIHIAQRFLEDFLNIKIKSIKPTNTKYKLTDKAYQTEFDFRCRADEEYGVVEMQRGYRKDTPKRFYTYGCISNALQLEDLTDIKRVEREKQLKAGQQPKPLQDEYKYIKPTKTIIWLADDKLGFKEDFVSFTMLPKDCLNFIKNDALWRTSKKSVIFC